MKLSETKCRRCSGCPHSNHHWIEGIRSDWELDDDNCDQVPQFFCKHCPAVGDECHACQGDGCSNDPNVPDCTDCELCQGEGVIPRVDAVEYGDRPARQARL